MSATDKPVGPAPASQQKKESPVNEKSNVAAPAVAPPPTLTVVQATHNDIPDICALYKKIWDEYKGKLPMQLERTWQPSPLEFTSLMEGVTFFTARRDKKLVGVLGCSEEEGAVRLVHLAVDPEIRHQGIATALLTSSFEWARRSGATSTWVEAMAQFHSAIALFRKAGFKEIGIMHKHLWKEDITLMELVF